MLLRSRVIEDGTAIDDSQWWSIDTAFAPPEPRHDLGPSLPQVPRREPLLSPSPFSQGLVSEDVHGRGDKSLVID